MSQAVDRADVLALLRGDAEVLDRLVELELVADGRRFAPEDVERALVARTLVRELEVNWPGVEVILRLRAEITATRGQVTELLRLVAAARAPGAESARLAGERGR